MQIRGICKVRDEAHIIQDTLDFWANYCNAGIHVYDDHSQDGTREICLAHPGVVEVLTSNLVDPDRERAEWFNRRLILNSAQRFLEEEDWLVYFDGDEHLEQFNLEVLTDEVDMVQCASHDVYITPEDREVSEWDYKKRRYVSQEYQLAPYFYSCRMPLDFYYPDQRNVVLAKSARVLLHGKVRHWGKGLSIKKWEGKCNYYAEVFGPKYAAKWAARRGQGVKEDMKSDYGRPLALWDDVLNERVETECRSKFQLVR